MRVACAHCRTSFDVHPSRAKHGRGKHCSPACQYAARRALPKNVLSCTCIGCGTTFQRNPSQLNGKRGAGKFCTRACRDRHWTGEVTPNWQDGSGVYKRGPNWQSTRRRILKRDKVCQCCGDGGLLHVHHVIPFRMFDSVDEANDDDNLVALCPPCHRRADARHKWVKLPAGDGMIRMDAGGYAWQLARERGLV